jgi:threonine dehydrogenase-like Zn-dependent dehydrogenase
MRAVTFDVNVPRYLFARTAGRISDGALFGRLTGLRLQDVPEPIIPGPRWARLKVLSSGICGTDVGNLSYRSSPAMEPFGSFPSVPGHEILAVVEKTGPAVTRVEVGQRVVVDPLLSCTVRGYAPGAECPSCRSGNHSTCENAGEEGPMTIGGRPLARGLTMGYHRDLPGGWGELTIAHESQLFPVSDALDDSTAALIEPLSIGMRAVIRAGPPPASTQPVLVIGSGAVALATVWALRATGFEGPVIAQAKRRHEARMHALLGATETITPGEGAREALVGTGARAYLPLVGPEVYSGGGFPLIFDCVGSRDSVGESVRYASPRGRIVLLGCAGELRRLDLTFLWARELHVQGFLGYGPERWRGRLEHTFQITQDLLTEHDVSVGEIVTHVFPLSQFGTALVAAANHGRSEAIKVLLKPAAPAPATLLGARRERLQLTP